MTQHFKSYKIPYVTDGNSLYVPREYFEPYWKSQSTSKVEWRDATPFPLNALQLIRYSRGHSSNYFEWQHPDTGCMYPMFDADMVDAVRWGAAPGGIIYDTFWEVYKQGAKFGIRIYQC